MNRYQVMLSDDLDAACRVVADEFDMSMEQVLSSAVQLCMERLTLESYESFVNVEPLRDYKGRYNKNKRIKD